MLYYVSIGLKDQEIIPIDKFRLRPTCVFSLSLCSSYLYEHLTFSLSSINDYTHIEFTANHLFCERSYQCNVDPAFEQ